MEASIATRQPAAPMTYARARLWLGITSVGTWVLLATAALATALPARLFPTTPTTLAADLLAILGFLALYVAISFPFDLLGGHLLPRRYHRSSRSLPAYLAAWTRGVLAQLTWMTLSATAILVAARTLGLPGATALVLALMILMTTVQLTLARLTAHLPARPRAITNHPLAANLWSSRVFESSDRGFVGGWVGLPGRDRLVVPDHWLDTLSAQSLYAQLTRRWAARATGTRRRGILLAWTWNTLGFFLAGLLASAETASPAWLVQTSLWFALWSFLGLLLLPTPSRRGVYECDQYAADRVSDRSDLVDAIRTLDAWQEDEPERHQGVETIFHPVPAAQNRILKLDDPVPARPGAWHANRMALPLSWCCLGLLSRAVHCNAGRPELWVMLPGD